MSMKKEWKAPTLEALAVSQTMKGWDKPIWPPKCPTIPDPSNPNPNPFPEIS